MGIFRALRIGSTPRPDVLASPWSESTLTQLVIADVFPDLVMNMPLTREAAITVPAVSKARNLLVSTIAPLPLRALDKDGLLEKQPSWLASTKDVSPLHRMAGTIDDLVFHGGAVWQVTRGSDGFVLTADHVPASQWRIDQGRILIEDEPVDADRVLYFPGPTGGLLNEAAGTIRGGIDLERAWTARVKQPIPAMELRETQEGNLTPSEVKDVLDSWKKALRSPEGAVGYVPMGYELIDHGSTDAALFTEGRNAVRTDIGAFTGIPAALLDASVSESSLTYITSEGERSNYLSYGAPLWSNPIAHRLSMDDVVPRGQRIRFDMSDLLALTPDTTGTPTED
jgi:hypothetical protein